MTKRINYSNNCVKEVFFILVTMKTWNTNIMLIAKLNQLMRIINMASVMSKTVHKDEQILSKQIIFQGI